MKTLFKLTLFVISLGLIFTACDGSFDSLVDSQKEANPLPDPSDPQGNAGDADFSRFITIGNSLTAGFMDAALYDFGQMNSIGAMMHQQLKVAGAQENFNQPDINSTNGFNSAASNVEQGLIFGRFKLDTSIPGPSPVVNGELPEAFTGDKSTLHNFGVPGIQIVQLLSPQTGGPEGNPLYNALYARFATDPGSSTILEDAIATDPTFFSLWIGNNDILGFALQGAVDQALPIFTTPADFEMRFSAVVNQLMQNTDAKGVVADIPPLLLVPYFRAVPFNPLPLNADQVAQLNQGYNQYNLLLNFLVNQGQITEEERDRRRIEFIPPEEGQETRQNAYVMEDPSLTATSLFGNEVPKLRQATAQDLTLFPAAQVLPTGVGTEQPMPPSLVLTPENQQLLEERRTQFNTIIADVVNQANADAGETRIALYETGALNSGFSRLWGLDGSGPGFRIGGFTLMPDFSPGGVFSTDGVHPNVRGNALVVNDFLRTIEEVFNATLPKYSDNDILAFPSVQLCGGDCLSQQQQMANVEYIWDFSKIPLQ